MVATSQIREHMEVLGSDGAHVGTVDHLADENRIKLTKSDSSDGKHHVIDTGLVDHVDQHVHLNVTADEAMDEWDDDLELDDDDDEAPAAGGMEEALVDEEADDAK